MTTEEQLQERAAIGGFLVIVFTSIMWLALGYLRPSATNGEFIIWIIGVIITTILSILNAVMWGQ